MSSASSFNSYGLLIDGRNRLEACQRAGITPTITLLNGDQDVASYIISANIHRRNLNKGQAAMIMGKSLRTKYANKSTGCKIMWP